MRTTLKAVAVAALAIGAATSANALTLFGGLNQFEDDNVERLIKGAGNTAGGILQVGDVLSGVIRFSKINQINGNGVINPPVPELTGIFETQITSILDANMDGIAERITFGSSASFEGVYGAGAMVAIFEGGALTLPANLNGPGGNCSSVAICEAAGTDGTHLFTFGFGDADDEWFSTGAVLDFGSLLGVPSASKVATVNYALSILENNSGFQFGEQALTCNPLFFACAGDGMTDLIGSGDVLGGQGLNNGYGARSDIDAQLLRVPEPGSLALFGLALAGLGFTGRRRKA